MTLLRVLKMSDPKFMKPRTGPERLYVIGRGLVASVRYIVSVSKYFGKCGIGIVSPGIATSHVLSKWKKSVPGVIFYTTSHLA